jgi:4-hydroxyphenylpyruvate dioxygenase
VMFKHSIASVSLPGTLIEKLDAVAKAGYHGLELFENDLTVSNLKPGQIAQIAKDLGLEIVGLQPFRDFEAMPKAMHLQNLERAKLKLELACKLDTKRLFVCSNTSEHTINSQGLAAEQLADLAVLAQTYGVAVGFEALSWGRFVNTYHQSIDIVEKANHPNLGHILDNYHIGVLGTPLDRIAQLDGAKITIAQIADAPYIDMSPMFLGRHYRCFPGQGAYPVIAYVEALIATGYRGYLSHEIFSDDFRSALLAPVALDGMRSLLWVEEMAKPTKPMAQMLDCQYVGFESSPAKQAPLLHALGQLGFSKTWASEHSMVYKSGQASIQIDKVPSQTLNVKSLGLQCTGVGFLHPWIQKLKYSAEITDNNILKVHGLENLAYLVYDSQELAFDVSEYQLDSQPKDNTIFRIDHIGHTVNAEQFHAVSLFYRTVFGLEIEPSLDLLDPNGIVNARVIKNHDHKIRISLNASKSKNTQLDKFKSYSKKADIQQVAFASKDIFKTAAGIIDQSIVLPIPANYYSDLQTKFIVDQTTLQKMQAYNILVDKNTEGMFFHFYLKEIDGLFFEVVQRIDKYDRYGEINAQLRLAAQARDAPE